MKSQPNCPPFDALHMERARTVFAPRGWSVKKRIKKWTCFNGYVKWIYDGKWWLQMWIVYDSMNKTWLMAILCHKLCGMLSQNMDISWSMVMFIGISWIFIMPDIFITGNHQSGFPQPIPWRIYNDYWCSPKKPSNCHSNSIIIYIYVYIETICSLYLENHMETIQQLYLEGTQAVPGNATIIMTYTW
jgi:hypothetical protein